MKQPAFILILIALFASACANVQTVAPFDMINEQIVEYGSTVDQLVEDNRILKALLLVI